MAKSTSSSSLKQATLGFSSSKRTASAASARGKKAVATVPRKVSSSTESPGRSDEEAIEEFSSVEGSSEPLVKGKKKLRVFDSRDAALNTIAGKGAAVGIEGEKLEDLYMQEKSGKWKKHYRAVRRKMGDIKPIHAESQTKVHQILRVFDLSYEYGPCIGVTRLERWERANALGLNPPAEVHEILLTKQGVEENEFSQTVFYDDV